MSSSPAAAGTSDSAQLSTVKAPIRRLFQFIQPFRGILYRSVFWSFINKVFDLAPPVIVGLAIDIVARQSLDEGFLAGIKSTMVTWEPHTIGLTLGALGFGIFALESLCQYLFSIGFLTLSQKVQHKIRVAAYEKVQSRELRFFEDQRLGNIMAILSDDVNQLERFLNIIFNEIVQIVALFIIAAVILLEADPSMSLIAILPMPLIIFGAIYFQKLLEPKYHALREAVSGVSTRLENNLSGIQVIKSFTAEQQETTRLSDASTEYKTRSIAAIKLSSLFIPLIRTGISISFGMVLWFGAVRVMEGTMSVGVFTLFGMMCQRILWPLTRLGVILDEMERCRASCRRIFSLLDSKPSIQDGPKSLSLTAPPAIELKDVQFSYPMSGPILRGLTYSFPAGKVVGVAGATGSGKSTLVKMLLRFYDPTSGQITIDGTPLDELSLKSLRQAIALVSQDVYVFHGTILENIQYGSPHASTEATIAAAKQAQLHEFVTTLKDGYETICGERGIKLSGGQRQRLSIARALLKNAPVMILDEATSSVDTETERAIQRGIDAYTKNRTAIIIAHRLSTLRHAHQIIVMKDGHIVESGPHDQLIAARGTYYDLWQLQVGEGDSIPPAGS